MPVLCRQLCESGPGLGISRSSSGSGGSRCTQGWLPGKVQSFVPAQLMQTGHLCTAGGNRSCHGMPGGPWALAGRGDHPRYCPNLHSLSLHLSWDFSALSNWNHDVETELDNSFTLAQSEWQTGSSEGAELSCA